ncbi:MAG: TonB-dependent receptor [Halioglobus sp.]|nr:TonB-dependent receptor [Halioglobus sp.]MDG2325618.1 TonB-dependent receptor [Halioglobus sp.]
MVSTYLATPLSAKRKLVPAVGMALALVAGQSYAQSALEEVIVTASKRAQTLQEVPIAVSVVSSEQIEQAGVLDIKDLQTLVPSLRVTQLQSSANTNFIIRGFGNGANNAGIEPSVGVFIDGVYRSRVGSALADLPKLERIEVLRGPQSTLFGKNASAGVISVITAKPDLESYSGSASVTVANYDQVIVKGDVTGPITDNLGFSLFASYNEREGYYENIELGTEENDLDRYSYRGQLLWEPTDRMGFRLIVDGESLDEICCGVSNLVDGPTGDVVRAIGGDLVGNEPFAYEGYYDFDPVTVIDTSGVSLEFGYDFDNVTLTSITAYRTLEQNQFGDVDYTSARLVSATQANLSDTSIDTFTQELRLTSDGDGSLAWMVGAFYFTEEVEIDGAFGYGDQFRDYGNGISGGAVNLLEALLGPVLGFAPGSFFAEGTGFPSEKSTQDDDTISVFAQGDFAFADNWTLTLGLNYTEVEKDVKIDFTNNDVFSSIPLGLYLPPTLAADAQAFQFLPPVVNYPNAVEDGSSKDDDTTYTVRLAWDVTDSMNVYAGVSTGFKASSWNLSRDSKPLAEDIPALDAAGLVVPNLAPGTRFASPEESIVYEIGLKAQYETISYNMAIFSQEIDDFQSNVFSGTGFNLANAGKQSVEGVEFDMNWYPINDLRVSFAATYLDPKYDEFEGALGVDGPTDLSGETPAGIPELSTNTSVTYNFQAGSLADGYVRVEHVYEDEVQVVDNVPKDIASREINMVNASLGLYFANGWEMNLWGRNLNEDEYLQSAFPSVAQAGSYSGYPNTPRTYGLTVRYSFE